MFEVFKKRQKKMIGNKSTGPMDNQNLIPQFSTKIMSIL